MPLNAPTHRPPAGPQTSFAPVPWEEIFTRHDAVLASHLEVLGAVKNQVALTGEASRAITSMVTKTIQAMNQSRLARKKMLNQSTSQDVPNTFTSSPPPCEMNQEGTARSQTTDTAPNSRKKRSRNETVVSTFSPQPLATEGDTRVIKRRRSIAEDNKTPNVSSVPPPTCDTEDISEEVQRRLRIKEELRRKRQNAKPEKRKRNSLTLGDGTSVSECDHLKKRARRTSSDLKRKVDSPTDSYVDPGNKRLKQTRGT
ncbi:Uncharacterized protein PECH_005437 [Penicillium ucsense]|uniref:Uncharacterized protein n=1 Tax=Penicillium ucsense TaxID=2839758 RepID=A0A8J8W2C4_9EURO|nr:Uncharacterized protein PECM_005976 [Penicillium ucsense]KAF7736336.1 Uncharacterized protein PECH_005437 [Penicillium ucsense]